MANNTLKLKTDPNLVVFGFHCKSILKDRDMVVIYVVFGDGCCLSMFKFKRDPNLVVS